MKYIREFFDDKHNFWNINTIICIVIFSSICIFDFITTIMILSRGGIEYNQFMAPFVTTPFLFLMIKITGINLTICGIKLMYDIIQDKFYTKYNSFCIYYAFAIPSGMTLCVVIHNIWVLL
jgi:hypothetical protein